MQKDSLYLLNTLGHCALCTAGVLTVLSDFILTTQQDKDVCYLFFPKDLGNWCLEKLDNLPNVTAINLLRRGDGNQTR
jgi:hypothetical protein